MKECFEGLIGLSQSDCECYEVDAALKESSLGLFVDDLEGIDMQLIKNALPCGDEFETNFNKLYNSAVNFYESDLQVAISENYRQRYSPYIGRIGEHKYDKPLNASTLMGLKLDTNNVDSASIVVSSASLFFDSPGTINLMVYKNETKLDTEYPIDVIEGTTSFSFPSPLNLPISENGLKNDYYFVFTSDGPRPMNNKNSCSCQGVESVRGKFLKPKGVSGTNYNTLSIDNNYANGISLNATMSCSIDSMLCDFMVDQLFHRRTGIALWYKMGVLMIEKLFASREINFDTMSDREYLYGRKNKFAKEYKNLILWLSENTMINNSNCFVCDSRKSMYMGKNLI
ncbi:hypothetical protein [Winogradskyella forsetii]|uniref:hypothetical protein n=1 Tax=Winogradskyella forsetii TaxID=2686077 RepID=UPI0015BF6153|nr:hypothetical protein [Winogradskyella forsetii]